MSTNQATAYYHAEWDKYQTTQQERQTDTLSAVVGIAVCDVLDIGCGAGQELLPFVSKLNATVTGVDVDPGAIQIAIQKFKDFGLGARAKFICCPAESLSLTSTDALSRDRASVRQQIY